MTLTPIPIAPMGLRRADAARALSVAMAHSQEMGIRPCIVIVDGMGDALTSTSTESNSESGATDAERAARMCVWLAGTSYELAPELAACARGTPSPTTSSIAILVGGVVVGGIGVSCDLPGSAAEVAEAARHAAALLAEPNT